MWWAAITAVAIAGCAVDPSAPPTPPATIHDTVIVSLGSPARAVPPTILIDGVARTRLDEEVTVVPSHHVEMRAGEVVVAAIDLAPADQACELATPLAATSESSSVLAYENGELRFESASVTTDGSGCVADGGGQPACYPGTTSCPGGGHCTSRAQSISPLYTHLACAPVGTHQLGDACALLPDTDGAYDDCADGLLCVAGACRALCVLTDDSRCATCANVDGEPAELAVCM
jgi:hypothetical protein